MDWMMKLPDPRVLLVALFVVPGLVQAAEIEVTASGSADVETDYAIVSFSIVSEDSSAVTAADLTKTSFEALLKALGELGVNVDQVAKTYYQVFAPGDGALVKATQVFEVQVDDYGLIDDVFDAASAVGARATGSAVYVAENIEPAVDMAISRAFNEAERRAVTMAKATGASLGELIEISNRGVQWRADSVPSHKADGTCILRVRSPEHQQLTVNVTVRWAVASPSN